MDTDYDKLWEDIFIVLRQAEDKLPHEKTLLELSTQFNVGKRRMQREIERLMEAGLLTSRKCSSKNGKPCTVYAPVPSGNLEHKPVGTLEEK